MSEYEPGDVAILMTEGGERVGFRCGVATNMGWQYAREPGQRTWSSDDSGYVTPIRPLVVLDPENQEDVERLAAACRAAFGWTSGPVDGDIDATQTALRSLVTPPKPAEPGGGLGAQVRDRDGETWVRNSEGAWINLHGSYGLDPALSWDTLCEKYGPIEVRP